MKIYTELSKKEKSLAKKIFRKSFDADFDSRIKNASGKQERELAMVDKSNKEYFEELLAESYWQYEYDEDKDTYVLMSV